MASQFDKKFFNSCPARNASRSDAGRTSSSVGIIGDHYLLSSIAELSALIRVGWFRLRYTSAHFLSLNSYV
jgi:hypothetical protein